jgi:hypothetical protein
MTPFFRRDGEVAGAVRDRIVRSRGGAGGSTPGGVPSRTIGGGTGSVAPIGGGRSGETAQPAQPATPSGSPGRGIDRGRDAGAPRDNDAPARPAWRDRGRSGGEPVTPPPTTSTPSTGTERPRGSESWRGRGRNDGPSSGSAPAPATPEATPSTGGSDVPRRVIDRINGPRIAPPRSRDNDNDGGSRDRGASTRQSGSRDRGSRDSGSRTRDAGSRDSGSGSRAATPQPAPQPRPQKAEPEGRRGDGDGGGRVKRDQ